MALTARTWTRTGGPHRLAKAVVHRPLLRVVQDFVGLLDLLKLLLGSLDILVQIRVIFTCQFTVGAFDFALGNITLYA